MSARSAYGLGVDRAVRWEENAACLWGGRLRDPEAWFITSKKHYLDSWLNREALAICQRECPVRYECHEATQTLREKFPVASEIRGGRWYDHNGTAHGEVFTRG